VIKRIELRLVDGWSYDNKKGWGVLCFSTLNEYFDLRDKPNKIDLILSDKVLKEGYFVQLISDEIHVIKPKREIVLGGLFITASEILTQYPKGIWAAIETYE